MININISTKFDIFPNSNSSVVKRSFAPGIIIIELFPFASTAIGANPVLWVESENTNSSDIPYS